MNSATAQRNERRVFTANARSVTRKINGYKQTEMLKPK